MLQWVKVLAGHARQLEFDLLSQHRKTDMRRYTCNFNIPSQDAK